MLDATKKFVVQTLSGTLPFSNMGMSNTLVATKRLEKWYLLPFESKEIPENCSELVTECWLIDPRMRPPAKICLEKIQELVN